jgi:hypothetical protein
MNVLIFTQLISKIMEESGSLASIILITLVVLNSVGMNDHIIRVPYTRLS